MSKIEKAENAYLEGCKTIRNYDISQQIVFSDFEELEVFVQMSEDKQKKFIEKTNC